MLEKLHLIRKLLVFTADCGKFHFDTRLLTAFELAAAHYLSIGARRCWAHLE
jgi:hypothetical protein